MNPQDIIALVQMVIQFLLHLFGKKAAAVKAYIDGTDTNVLLRPFVLKLRQAKLRVFTKGYAVLHGLNPEYVYSVVLNGLKRESLDSITAAADQVPAK